MTTKASLNSIFKEKFGTDATVTVKSPGRINIIGEHTDYNNGFVLPAAIDKYIYVALSERNDNELHLISGDYNEAFQTELDADYAIAPDWAKYIIGVSQLIQKRTSKLTGFNLYVVGDVPLGAGLSSSAAFSCATAYGLNELFNCDITRVEIAKIGQQTEHEYIGLKCGIMDQFASVLGKDNHAIQLDCRDLTYKYVPIDWSEYEILLLNTNVKHTLASSAYNKRRESCEQGVQWVKEQFPEVESLRDVTESQLESIVKPKDIDTFTKCLFVVQENQRLLKACDALASNKIEELGKLLFEAHWALSTQYEVSCPELDFLITAAQTSSHVVGARMMGGGFGGCTINIVRKGESDNFINEIETNYENKFNLKLTPIRVNLGEGSSILN